MTELRKCPFCGANVAVVSNVCEIEQCGNFEDSSCPHYYDAENCDGGYFVVCDATNGGCGGSCGWRQTKEEAIEAWNKRVPCDTCAMYFPDDGCMAGLAEGEATE